MFGLLSEPKYIRRKCWYLFRVKNIRRRDPPEEHVAEIEYEQICSMTWKDEGEDYEMMEVTRPTMGVPFEHTDKFYRKYGELWFTMRYVTGAENWSDARVDLDGWEFPPELDPNRDRLEKYVHRDQTEYRDKRIELNITRDDEFTVEVAATDPDYNGLLLGRSQVDVSHVGVVKEAVDDVFVEVTDEVDNQIQAENEIDEVRAEDWFELDISLEDRVESIK